jgi:hypothetical protein
MKKIYLLVLITLFTMMIVACDEDDMSLNGRWMNEDGTLIIEIEENTHIMIIFESTDNIITGKITNIDEKDEKMTIKWDLSPNAITYNYSLYSDGCKLKIVGGKGDYFLNFVLNKEDIVGDAVGNFLEGAIEGAIDGIIDSLLDN